MSIFEPSTPVETSPIEGQEVETAEELMLEEEVEQEQEIQEDESVLEESEEEESPEEGQEELIAGKFKSQDDLVKAYKNLEREFHKSRQQRQPESQQQYQEQQDPNEVFWSAFQNDPFGTLQYLVQNAVQSETAPIYEQQQTAKLRDNFGSLSKEYQQLNTEDGLVTFANKIQEIADELGNPSIVENPSPRIMRMAALEAFGDSKANVYKQAKEKGRMEAENARRAKQGLNAPRGTKPKQTQKTPEELIAESIVSAGTRGGLFG